MAGDETAGGKSRYLMVIVVVMGLAVVAGAVALIVAVAGGGIALPNGGSGNGVSSNDRGSARIASSSDLGSDTVGSGHVVVVPVSAARGPGSAVAGVSSDRANTAGSNGPNTASGAADGSAQFHNGFDDAAHSNPDSGRSTAVMVEQYTEINVSSVPPGAKILVDYTDTGKITPAMLSVPKKPGVKINISLRLKGYKNFTFPAVDLGESLQLTWELVKAHR